MPGANDRISLAHNARTICIAFVAFASRYQQGNIREQQLDAIFAAARTDSSANSQLYEIFSNLEGISYFIPPTIFAQRDRYDELLDKLFTTVINAGITSFSMASRYDATLTATNYLKKDQNYYGILSDHWTSISAEINQILKNII